VNDDWLDHGHGPDGGELAPILSSSKLSADRAGVSPARRPTSGWRGVTIGAGLAVLATIGLVGVANALGENLFPNIGSTRPASVWQNPVPAAEPAPTRLVARTPPTSMPIPSTTTPPSSTVAAAPITPSTTAPSARHDDVEDRSGKDRDQRDDVVVTSTSAPDVDDEPDDRIDDRSGRGSGSRDSGTDDSGSSGSGSGSDDDERDDEPKREDD
jgi:hypothetical protein